MGVITEIGAGIGAAVAAAAIWEKLNTSRTCLIEFTNNTDHHLHLESQGHAHGGFAELPSREVPPRSVDHFGSQSKSGSIFTGTEGYANYNIGEVNAIALIRWNNPFAGSNGTYGSSEGERGAAFEVLHLTGAGNDAKMSFELRQTRDPRLVRPPDYRWVRLEGYAYDPRHNWWPGGPDNPPSFPPGHHVLQFHSWYSPAREDNWATAAVVHTSRLPGETHVNPDYGHYRFEGYILSPNHPAPEGTVPLHSWYSRSRGDNWATTDPRHTNPLRHRIDPSHSDYHHYYHEGYLLSPLLPQPQHTVPVHTWYSPSRGDHFITTDPRYYP